MAPAPLVINWRHGEYSDWPCTLGDATYNLHKVVLAAGSRSSGFFKGAFNEGFKAAGTDLATLLPPSCHAYVESALDFIYGGELKFTMESALALYKIADVLSIDSLMEPALAALSAIDEGTLKQFEFALSLELPSQVVEALLPCFRVEDVIEVLAERPAEPHQRMLLQSCAKKLRIINHGEMDLLPCVQRTTFEKSVRLTFSPRGVLCSQRLHKSPIGTNPAVCRVRVDSLADPGARIGVSRPRSNDNWWGLCLRSGVASAGRNVSWKVEMTFTGQVIQMRMDRPKQALEFTLEKPDGNEHKVGSIPAAFDSFDDLVFTVCGCLGVQLTILQMTL